MPESICLHIQDRESGPIRVVEIPWISVRIGCAAYCEVRLADLELAAEACRLQRRGRTWHLVPLGPKGSILVQDRPIEGPYPLPFDVPFRIGSICFTLRQNRSSDPDWEMYRTLSSAQDRRPMSINPLSVSLPAVERRIASIAPPRSQRGIVHESSSPLPPRIESPLERSASPRPVNPWEARWKAAGARLQAERKQPLPPARPHPSPPADRYQSVPLKEPSVPLSRKAEPAVSPSLSREFSTHPLTPAAAPGYPVPPSTSARSRLDANLPIEMPTQPVEPSIATVRLEKITTRDRQPASLFQTRDQGSQLDRPDHACPEIRIERADSVPERSELEAGIEPTGDVGMVQSTEAEKPGIESIAEEGAEDGVWVAQQVQRFVADTSWTGTISFLEMGPPDVIVSTSTEASGCLEAGESDREERARIPNLRTATLPDPARRRLEVAGESFRE